MIRKSSKNPLLKHFLYRPLIAAVSMVATLLFSGLADTSVALAASACNTADFESFYLSAVDGRTTLALTKNPLTWNDTKTLANSNGGRVVTVSSVDQNSEIATKLATGFTSGKAWIGLTDLANTAAWTMQGSPTPIITPERFTWSSGTSSFQNYAAGQPDDYCTPAEKLTHPDRLCYGENWVAINSNGTWSDEGDHGSTPLKLKGVVEWPNSILDCVKEVTPPVTTPIELLPDVDQGVRYCKNQAGLSLAVCVDTTDGGKLCPQEKLACESIQSEPTCPAGSTLNTVRDMCQANHISVTCPSGYTWDATIDRCVVEPVCTGDGIYNSVANRCEAVVSADCPNGYTLEGGTNKCIMPMVCPNGGTYNPTAGVCQISAGCSANYTLNAGANRCELDPPTCPAGSSYSTTVDKCVEQAKVCKNGYTWVDARSRCEKTPECGTGTYDAALNKCTTPTTEITSYSEPTTVRNTLIKWKARGNVDSYTWSSTPAGILDVVMFYFSWDGSQVSITDIDAWGGNGQCAHNSPDWEYTCGQPDAPVTSRDANGRLVVSQRYTYPTFCTSWDMNDNCIGWGGGSFLGIAAAGASPSEFQSCPSGYTPTAAPTAAACTQVLTLWGNYSGFTDCSSVNTHTCAAPVQACPVGTTLSNGVCVGENPTCTGGSFDPATDTCHYQAECDTTGGWVLDINSSLCTQAVSCIDGGILDVALDKCLVSLTDGCPGGYVKDPATQICTYPISCGPGFFNTTSNRCEAAITGSCAAPYISEPLTGKCVVTPTCPADAGFSGPDPINFSWEIDKCVTTPVHACGAGLTWMSIPYSKCEAVPVCAAPGLYSQDTDVCIAGQCPGGLATTCRQIVGDTTKTAEGTPMTWCSPNQCQDDTSGMITDVNNPPQGANDLTDDGAKNDDGTCAGQLYIFNGRDMRCIKDDIRGMVGSIAKIVAVIVLSIVSAGALGAIAFNVAVAAQAATGMSMAAASMVQSVVTAVLTSALTSIVNLGIDAMTVGVDFKAWATQSAMSMASGALSAFMSEVGSSAYQALKSGMSSSSTLSSIDQSTGALTTTNITTTKFKDGMDTVAGFEKMGVNYTSSAEVPFTTNGVNGSFTGTLKEYSGPLQGTQANGTMGEIKSAIMGSTVETTKYYVNEAQNTITKVVTTMTPDPTEVAKAAYYAGKVYDEVKPAMNTGMLASYSTKKCCYPDTLSSTCTPAEIEEWGLQQKGLCHKVGTYCDTKFLSWCMAHKETSCCFSSKLARIIHEQGRPQLKSFGENGGWGSNNSPFCRGFTPNEFQMLDFGQINLDEYIADLSGQITEMAPNLTNYMDSVSGAASDRAKNLTPAGE